MTGNDRLEPDFREKNRVGAFFRAEPPDTLL